MRHQYDFLAIGSGLAGLTFALRVAEYGKVAVLTKASLTDANTSWAQGGIAAAIGESDSWELHERDTLVAGAGLCDPTAVRVLVQQAPDAIDWLLSLGANFDRDARSELDLHREGGHSHHRIVHHQDRTGWEIERTMVEAVRKHPNIEIFENTFVASLAMHQGRCVGVNAMLPDLGEHLFLARAIMLATGGCGRMYQHTTNPRVATADGVALAHDAGATVRDMEFMQFHPTTLYHESQRGFLITEAVRGAGGILRNHTGRRFMYDYDPRLELAPRDVVARAIVKEIERLGTWCVYLDTTHLGGESLQRGFPTIWAKLRELGIEMEKDWIPVVPAQHYSCGGVATDTFGRTSVPGLYAAGEVASTGVHGANRLASNSLLEGIVFAARAADSARGELTKLPETVALTPVRSIAHHEALNIRRKLQRLMRQEANIVRTTAGLQRAMRELARLREEFESSPETDFDAYALETRNLIIAAEHVVQGALIREKNVGLHFNADLAESGSPRSGALAPSGEPSAGH